MKISLKSEGRRGFLSVLSTGLGVFAGRPAATQAANQSPIESALPEYARRQMYRSRKQSSFDRSGGNHDFQSLPPGETLTVFRGENAGVITHIWFTIAARSNDHLRELVFRAYWDGNSQPSVQAPIGDFFGLTVGEYVHYESAFLACSPGKSLNCYFAMPYRTGARLTVTNEGAQPVGSLYTNIDYQEVNALPDDCLYFHAQYRQATPCPAPATAGDRNLDGRDNYVFAETRGEGHLMGVTFGVVTNADGWFGEGDEMIFLDDESKPAITGTGTEDYLCGSWDFGGREGATPFAHRFYGAPLISNPERTGARYAMYRWHGDNPVTFSRYLKHTIEHGHANDRRDNFYSVCYWYQRQVASAFPPLPAVADRRIRLHNNP